MLKRTLVAGALSGLLILPTVYSSAQTSQPTTLDQTIVGDGSGALSLAEGEKRVTLLGDWKNGNGKGRALGGFKQISDVHVVDEESPGRVEYFDDCDQRFSSSYRPQEALSAQVGESMLRRLSKIKSGPATGTDLTFTISTGDNIDNNQYNELRWFIDLMDGEEVVPDSGAIGGYHGYTIDHADSALPTELILQAQERFDATGAKQPWYAVLGNHDGLAQGNIRENIEFQFVVQGGKKVLQNIQDYVEDGKCPDPFDYGAQLDAFQDAFLNNSTQVPSDRNRRLLTPRYLHEEFFNTSGKPRGHGLNKAPDYPYTAEGDSIFPAGYYAFDISEKIVGVSMDTISYDLSDAGQIDNEQFKWLEETLRANSKRYFNESGKRVRNRHGENNMIVLFSHHGSGALDNPDVPDSAPDAMLPLHCFEATSAEGCEGGEGLRSLIERYPNVIAWVDGHEHNNRITHFPYEGDPTRSFWEINTAAHIDWPQQSRLIEIAFKPGKDGKPDTVFIYATMVDHVAAAQPDAEVQDPIEYLASISRVESYRDACIREAQADCAAPGSPEDRNVKLVLKAPFDLGH